MLLSGYCYVCCFFFFKQKTAYELRISDWSSDVCSSDLVMMPNSVSMPTIFGTAIGSDRGMGSETGVGSASEQPAAFRGSKRPHGREAEVAGHRYWPVATRSMDRPPCRSSASGSFWMSVRT